MGNLVSKIVEKIKTHILCSVTPPPENHAVYKITWENIVERGRPQMAIWRMRIACWITRPRDTHTLGIFNIYCSSTAPLLTRTRLIVTLCVHCLYFFGGGSSGFQGGTGRGGLILSNN